MSLLNVTVGTFQDAKEANQFSWLDHSVFAFMLVMSTVVGVLIGVCGKQDTKVDYLLGGKKMGILPISMSLIFSHLSGVTFMGMPAEIYTYNTMYFMTNVAGIIVALIIGYVFLPVFFNLQLTSTYEYLELRFDQKVRIMASLLFTVSLLLYLPIVVYVPALAFNHVSGISIHFITTVVVSVCVLYTMLGGIKAVVWTDFLQSFVTMGSCLAVIILGLIKIGGFKNMWDISYAGGRIEFFDWDPSPFQRNTVWTIFIGTTFNWLSTLGVSQGMVQKFVALPNIRSAKLTMSSNLNCLSATIYEDFISPIIRGNKKLESKAPFFMKSIVVVVGAISLAMVFVVEKLGGILQVAIAANGVTSGATLGIFVNGMFFPWANSKAELTPFQTQCFTERLEALGIDSGTFGSVTRNYVHYTTQAVDGCLTGSIVSLISMAGIVAGAHHYKATGTERFPYLPTSTDGCEKYFNFTPPVLPKPTPLPGGMGDDAFFIFKISFLYYTMVGTIINIIVCMVVSYFTGFQNPKEVDSRLLVPFMQKYGSAYQEAPTEPLEKEMTKVTPPLQYEQTHV
uniref:Sodium-coupled monocarboxylate transporter 1 n=1 Tax=Timema cristinae TaxID=61476 RepID=A0A7R9GZM5_TIMCR|nr:unnamed protein product [Timema cristinae]